MGEKRGEREREGERARERGARGEDEDRAREGMVRGLRNRSDGGSSG